MFILVFQSIEDVHIRPRRSGLPHLCKNTESRDPILPIRCRTCATPMVRIRLRRVAPARTSGALWYALGMLITTRTEARPMTTISTDARVVTTHPTDPAEQCGQPVPGSHARTCVRARAHEGRHHASVKCSRCHRRPLRHPRAWAGARVSGPGLCAPCARTIAENRWG